MFYYKLHKIRILIVRVEVMYFGMILLYSKSSRPIESILDE